MTALINFHAFPRWLSLVLSGAALLGFYMLEQLFPKMGLWLFLVLTLTLGMGHGALDAVILLGQFKPLPRAITVGFLYLLLTLLSGWLLSLSFSWALIALLLMSIWHFGEKYSQNMMLRMVTGGVSLMAPALLQNPSLRDLLQGVTTQNFQSLLVVWTSLAWIWAALSGAVVVMFLKKCLGRGGGSDKQDAAISGAMLEIGIVVCMNFVLSPLLQFALYFGVFHCTSHIVRLRRALLRHQIFPLKNMIFTGTAVMLLTAILMLALWQWLAIAGEVASQLDAQILQWLVTALGAVTVPHLLLIGYSRRWLG